MLKNIYKELNQKYEEKRRRAQKALEDRKKEIYEIIPDIRDIDDAIHSLGLQMSRTVLNSTAPVVEIAHEINEYKLRISQLKKEKIKLLLDKGYPANYLEVIYQCPLCEDKGIIFDEEGPRQCPCYRQSVIEELYRNSNIDSKGEYTFDKFDFSYYPDHVSKEKYGISISPRENIKKIVSQCQHFVENIEDRDEKNILLCGTTGVGKTFLCGCIANALISRGIPVLYLSATALFKIINEARMKRFELGDNTEYETIMDIEVLIIDDLGTESQTESRYAELLELLNTREANNRNHPCKTVFSTNLNIKEIFSRYSERIGSRISGSFNIYRLVGDDIRIVKKQRENS